MKTGRRGKNFGREVPGQAFKHREGSFVITGRYGRGYWSIRRETGAESFISKGWIEARLNDTVFPLGRMPNLGANA